MTKKELDNLYKTGVEYQYGKNGVEKSVIMAMEYYSEFLEEAEPSHSRYVDVNYGMALAYEQMGDMCKKEGMKEDAMNWYNDSKKHYEVVLVDCKNKPFNDRLLAEVNYDGLLKKIENCNKKSFLQKLFGK
jgi:hypothetical protein